MGWVQDTFGGGGGGGSTRNIVSGGVAGNMLGGPAGAMWGAAAGSRGGQNYWDRITGRAGQRMKSADYNRSLEQQYDAQGQVLDRQRGQDAAYYNRMAGATGTYQTARNQQNDYLRGEIDSLKKQSQSQANDARQVYSTQVQPNLKNIMESSRKDAASAMSLADAGNVNNSVQTGVRNLYNQEAQGIQRRGLQDAGVLAGLGAQATAQQMGGMPIMSGGQMAAMQAQNQSQSAQAYSKAQQRMQALREQGIEAGFRESDAQFQRGQQAKDRYASSVNNIQDSDDRFRQSQRGFRDEQYGYGRDRYGLGLGQAQEDMGLAGGLAGLKYGQQKNMNALDMGRIGDYYGTQQQNVANQMAASQAQTAAAMGAIGTIGGGVAGAFMGGPAGAGAGAQMGGAAAGAMAPQQGMPAANYGYGSRQGYQQYGAYA